jgi:hypothetical protein
LATNSSAFSTTGDSHSCCNHGRIVWWRVVAKVVNGFTDDLFSSFLAWPTPIGPRPSWMQNIPTWTESCVAPLTRIVIAKTIDQFVPKRIEFCDKQGFAKGYPDVVNDQIAAMKIGDVNVKPPLNTSSPFPPPRR